MNQMQPSALNRSVQLLCLSFVFPFISHFALAANFFSVEKIENFCRVLDQLVTIENLPDYEQLSQKKRELLEKARRLNLSFVEENDPQFSLFLIAVNQFIEDPFFDTDETFAKRYRSQFLNQFRLLLDSEVTEGFLVETLVPISMDLGNPVASNPSSSALTLEDPTVRALFKIPSLQPRKNLSPLKFLRRKSETYLASPKKKSSRQTVVEYGVGNFLGTIADMRERRSSSSSAVISEVALPECFSAQRLVRMNSFEIHHESIDSLDPNARSVWLEKIWSLLKSSVLSDIDSTINRTGRYLPLNLRMKELRIENQLNFVHTLFIGSRAALNISQLKQEYDSIKNEGIPVFPDSNIPKGYRTDAANISPGALYRTQILQSLLSYEFCQESPSKRRRVDHKDESNAFEKAKFMEKFAYLSDIELIRALEAKEHQEAEVREFDS